MVAERVGRDAIRISRPGVIEWVPPDFGSHPDFAGAPHLIEFVVEQGWYDPGSGPFNANTVYGDGEGPWSGARWIADELASRAARPERIGLADVMWAVRTERLTGDSAGYGQVIPLRAESHPDLRLLWHARVGAIAAPFMPFFLGIEAIPPEYRRHRYLTAGESAAFIAADGDRRSTVSQRVEATRSAVVIFKRLFYLLAEHHELFLAEVKPVWEALESATADHCRRSPRKLRCSSRPIAASLPGTCSPASARLRRCARSISGSRWWRAWMHAVGHCSGSARTCYGAGPNSSGSDPMIVS